MSIESATASKRSALFGTDLDRLKREWAKMNFRDDDSYLRALRGKFEELAEGEDGRKWYLPHWILKHLVEGSSSALALAKETFLAEWRFGEKLNRKEHYWNSLQFQTGDRWICAAMAAQLVILFDWLAAAGVFSGEEIDAIAGEALQVMEAHIEPHLKGRGHMPLLPDPINQTAACVCGLLFVGYMFGMKWRNDSRARRMYAFARNLLADCIGQYPANGYDTDGFTYLRHIHLQVHVLSVALLEEVEGNDWYHQKFAPHDLSLADLNAMQLAFVTPSGFTWPLGRYGYVKSWNLFCQSFAAKRTGDPRYLQIVRRDSGSHRFNSPWLGMELALGLLWYPYELDDRISLPLPPPVQKRRLIENSWAVFTNDADRMLAVATWYRGKAPQFFLEAHGSPLILGGMEEWPTSNCVQCDPEKWGRNSWMNPPGKLKLYCDIPGLQAVCFDGAASYPNAIHAKRATRSFVNCTVGMIVSDRFAADTNAPVMWQATTWAGAKIRGNVANVEGLNKVAMRAVSASSEWTFRATPERKIVMEGRDPLNAGMLELQGESGRGEFDVLLDWRQEDSAITLKRLADDLLATSAGEPKNNLQVLLYADNGERKLGPFATDARLAVLGGDGLLSAAGVRSVREGDMERVWASLPIDVTLRDDAVWISGLKYGEFVTLRSKEYFVCIRVGNGVEVWGRTPKPLKLHVRYPAVAVELNGEPVDARMEDGWTEVEIRDTSSKAAEATAALKAAVEGGKTGEIIRGLHEVQQAMAWECADDVRKLFTWDAAKEPVLPGNDLKTEATYVRLEAAAAAGCLGDRAAIGGLMELLKLEAHYNYAPVTFGFGGAKWWGFPTRSVTIESLMILHASEALGIFDEILAEEAWPHGIDAIARARAVL